MFEACEEAIKIYGRVVGELRRGTRPGIHVEATCIQPTLADAVVLHAGSGSFRRGTRSTRYRKGLNKCRSCLETCQERCCGLILRNWACAY